jgi:hypothetical protein
MEKNIMPEFHLFPRIERVIEAVGKVLILGHVTEPCLSEHKRGGSSELLDDVMYRQLELDYDSRD